MKTTILTTIALTTLFTLNAHAATFVMQAHTPSGIQVLEGNKGSEVPVVQVPSTPSQPSANWVISNFESFNGQDYAGAGHYDNMTCFGQQANHISAIMTMGGLMLQINKNGSNVSTPDLKFADVDGRKFI